MSDAETRHPCYISKESLVPFFLEPAEHDLDPVATFASALVVPDGRLPFLPARDARTYLLVLQGFSEPIGIIATISEQPFHVGQPADQGTRPNVIADGSGSQGQVDGPALAVADGVSFVFMRPLVRPIRRPRALF